MSKQHQRDKHAEAEQNGLALMKLPCVVTIEVAGCKTSHAQPPLDPEAAKAWHQQWGQDANTAAQGVD